MKGVPPSLSAQLDEEDRRLEQLHDQAKEGRDRTDRPATKADEQLADSRHLPRIGKHVLLRALCASVVNMSLYL
jgi:hypothetical protein